ncbi:ankyrin repeat domain-containing protein [Novosphingobium sp. G106]|uniref:ankyrin repeat domain-containing protein n=1 Tax=Novosphingobium sp. G106 TaxID=2849500 RepID=UPI0028121A0D|nr:ankyrin repeat domain-containing protein [Novosphingobium sp. G106]
MIKAGKWRTGVLRILVTLLAGAVLTASPAQAQFSAGWKFLEAVRKKDGTKVEEALNEPGSTIVNTRDVTTGRTALHIVTERRDLTWMSFLIGRGANVNLRDAQGVTPLQLASNLGFIEGIELLVESKARIDDPNDAGETPLISAVHRRNTEMARILLKAGADPDRKDNSGRSARDYATLDGAAGGMLAEIQASAKPASQRPGSGRVYGPSF